MNLSATTYRAVQATAPGTLELIELPIPDPPAGAVRVRVEACGICHTDAATVEAAFPVTFPRVPGHEVVGRIEAVGDGVPGNWTVGQRVGVGFLAGPCGACGPCRHGNLVACENQAMTGVDVDGGWAEMLIAQASGLISIPDELDAVEAAPLLCAGLTTFAALRKSGARPGDTVAVLGVGGLGHLGVQYARRMGFRVVAIARGPEKAALAERFGAHHYIDSTVQDPAAELTRMGGARLVVSTASSSAAMAGLLPGVAPDGELLVLGGDAEPLAIATTDLIFGGRAVVGSLTGTAGDTEDALAFSVLQDIRAMTETVSLDEAPAAYARMLANEARFRMVIDLTS
jgi:propanol-preferring alcohol dehydrogenase